MMTDVLSFRSALALPEWWGGATTVFATGAAETVKRWRGKLWIELPREIYFSKWMKKDDHNTVIEIVEDLEGGPGDNVKYTLLMKLSNAAITGDNPAEGQEEALTVFTDNATLDQNRNAVRLVGEMSEIRTAFNQRDGAKTVLRTWLAETIDNAIFTGMNLSPSTTIFGGAATSKATIDATSKFTPSLIDKAAAKAKKASPKFWPVRVGSKDVYICLVHTDTGFDIRRDSEWEQAQREASDRGMEKNPMFMGAFGYWNGTIIHEHEKVPVGTNAGSGSNQPFADNFFLGRQAGIFAWGKRPQWWEKEFDFGNSIGFCVGAIYVFKKSVFNATDHAMFQLETYRTNL